MTLSGSQAKAAWARGMTSLVLAQLTLGTAAIFVRLALSGTGPMTASFLRVLIAAPLAIGAARVRKVDLRWPLASRIRLVAAGCMLGLHFVTWIAALQYTSVAIATLLVCTTPFGLTIVDALHSRRLPPPASILAFPVAAIAAVIVVMGGAGTAHANQSNPLLGAALSLLGAVLIGGYLMLIRSVRSDRSTLAVVAYTYPSAVLVLAPLALCSHERFPVTALAWFGILGMTVVVQLIGHTALAASLKAFTPSSVAFAGLAEPPIAAALAALTLGEPLTLPVVAGGLVLLASIGVVLAQQPIDADPTALELPSP